MSTDFEGAVLAIHQLKVFRVLFVADGAARCEHALVMMLRGAGTGRLELR